MRRRKILFLVCIPLLLVVSASATQSASPAIKSHHLLNLPASITEAEFATLLHDLNAAIAEAGYPDAGYRLWKVTGEQVGDYNYLWEGNWPSQEAYDGIHDHTAYVAAVDRLRSTFEAMEEHHIYNRYVEIPLGN